MCDQCTVQRALWRCREETGGGVATSFWCVNCLEVLSRTGWLRGTWEGLAFLKAKKGGRQ